MFDIYLLYDLILFTVSFLIAALSAYLTRDLVRRMQADDIDPVRDASPGLWATPPVTQTSDGAAMFCAGSKSRAHNW